MASVSEHLDWWWKNRRHARLARGVLDTPPLVPRDDGRILAGATEEDAGFDTRSTPEAVAGLIAEAIALCPALETAEVERSWAGLRPGSLDGRPLQRVRHRHRAERRGPVRRADRRADRAELRPRLAPHEVVARPRMNRRAATARGGSHVGGSC